MNSNLGKRIGTGTGDDKVAALACLAPARSRVRASRARWFQSARSAIADSTLRGRLVVLGFGLIALSLLLPSSDEPDPASSKPQTGWVSITLPENSKSIALPGPLAPSKVARINMASASEAEIQVAAEKPNRWKTLEVSSGDTLASLFKQVGLGAQDVHRIVHHDENTQALTRIFPGQVIDISLDSHGEFAALGYDLPGDKRLGLKQTDEGLASKVTELELDYRMRDASSWVHDSLFNAGQRAGLSDNLIMQLAEIFGWDIDFVLDIRSGDHFSVLYNEVYRDGEKVRDGQILAAAFTNRGKTFQAVRYENSSGNVEYYSPSGRNMRKAFLRSPVDFSRISSRFSYARKHPVLKGVTRPHRGVDYAASRGTPVRSTGDGKVIYRNKNRSYGNHVIIQHGSQYKTLYAHLSKFSSKAKKGSRVRQGQTIGYVGATGLVTAAHLHYEFRVNDVHKNPLKVKFPKADPLPKAELARFQQATETLTRQLDLLDQTLLASKTTP